MIVHYEDAPTPPPCWNREPGPASYTRYGIDQLSGERIEVEIRMDWAKPGCRTWDAGIEANTGVSATRAAQDGLRVRWVKMA